MTNEFILEFEEEVDEYIDASLAEIEEIYSSIGISDLCPMMLYEDVAYNATADLTVLKRFIEEKGLQKELEDFKEDIDGNFFVDTEMDDE